MKIVIGTAQFDPNYGITRDKKKFNLKLKRDLLRTANKFKINTIDTAVSYKNAENQLGKIGVNRFKIITKLPKRKTKDIKIDRWILNCLSGSLKKMKVKKLYGLLIHYPQDLNKKNKDYFIKALQNLKKKKLIKKTGISLNNLEDLNKILKFWKPDILQIPYSILDKRLEKESMLKKIKKHKIEVHVRSIFLQGLLVKKTNSKKFFRWRSIFKKWFDWCEQKNLKPFEAAYLYVLKNKAINKIVVGFDNPEQLVKLARIRRKIIKFPKINCSDKMLLNPYNWKDL